MNQLIVLIDQLYRVTWYALSCICVHSNIVDRRWGPVREDDRPKYSNACINNLSVIDDNVKLVVIGGYNVQPTLYLLLLLMIWV